MVSLGFQFNCPRIKSSIQFNKKMGLLLFVLEKGFLLLLLFVIKLYSHSEKGSVLQ